MEGSRLESHDPETKLLQSIYRDALKSYCRSGIGFGVGFVLAEGLWSLLRRTGQQPSPWRRAVFTLGVSCVAAVTGALSGSARYLDRLVNELPASSLAQQSRYVLRHMGYLKPRDSTDSTATPTETPRA